MKVQHELLNFDKMSAQFDWLCSEKLRSDEGWILSWENDDHPGYPYPEVSGYMLHLIATWPYELQDFHKKRMEDFVAVITKTFLEYGALERHGICYSFDTAIGLSGLLAYAKNYGEVDKNAVQKAADFIYESLDRKLGVTKEGAWFEDAQWSLHFEPHLIKCLMALERAREFGIEINDNYKKTIEILTGFQREDGAFALSNMDHVDTHVHCYATEGLLYANRENDTIPENLIKAADWLAANQNEDGGTARDVKNFDDISYDIRNMSFADVTSQTVRIFAIIDPIRYEKNIKKGLDFLLRLRTDKNALRYNLQSNDLTTWANMFASQMYLYLDGKATVDQLF